MPVPVSSYKLNLRAKRIFGTIRGLALSPDQLKHLIFTHGHSYRQHRRDLDIPMAKSGGPFRPIRGASGRLRQVMCRLLLNL